MVEVLEDPIDFYVESHTPDAMDTGKEMDRMKRNECRRGNGEVMEAPFDRGGTFRLMDLPAELRVHIYQFLLPHALIIWFDEREEYGPKGSRVFWNALSRSPKSSSDDVQMIGGKCGPFCGHRIHPCALLGFEVETQMFRVSKAISQEASAILYGSNMYQFDVDGRSHGSKSSRSLTSPLMFGPLGALDIRLPLLRNLRSIRIYVTVHERSHWENKRHHGRLGYFIDVLKKHSDDENRRSLLQNLEVCLRDGQRATARRSYNHYAVLDPRPIAPSRQLMFGLEKLATLRGIKDVSISDVPDWFAECLQLCIQGKGGDVHEVHWPLIETRRRKSTVDRRWTKVWVSTRKWYQPTLNWKEYAERNEIAIPEDIDKYWAQQD